MGENGEPTVGEHGRRSTHGCTTVNRSQGAEDVFNTVGQDLADDITVADTTERWGIMVTVAFFFN